MNICVGDLMTQALLTRKSIVKSYVKIYSPNLISYPSPPDMCPFIYSMTKDKTKEDNNVETVCYSVTPIDLTDGFDLQDVIVPSSFDNELSCNIF